jgi:hypothetical protein
MKTNLKYAEAIMRDERDKFLKETPTVFESGRIERVYEFFDGAIVKYEWQASPSGRISKENIFNHRFTLTAIPSPNPNKLQTGIILVINYPQA